VAEIGRGFERYGLFSTIDRVELASIVVPMKSSAIPIALLMQARDIQSGGDSCASLEVVDPFIVKDCLASQHSRDSPDWRGTLMVD
jgi:hypothetical protein